MAPVVLSLRPDHVEATLSYVEQIEMQTAKPGGTVYVNLADCDEISRSSCLLLTAQIERSLERMEGCVVGCSPRSPAVCQNLHDFGFYRHLHFMSPIDFKTDGDVPPESICVCSGAGVSEDLSERLERVAQVARFVFDDEAFVEKVHAALNEAVTNIVGHAYLNETGRRHRQMMANAEALGLTDELDPAVDPAEMGAGRWWFAGHADIENRELFLYALDHGYGVPTIAPWTMRPTIDAFYADNPRSGARRGQPFSEAETLNAVARACRAGYGTGRRGKGFPTMIGLVETETKKGSLVVVSGAARYEFRQSAALKPIERCSALSKSFPGTLLEWRIAAPRLGREKGGRR